MNIFTDAEVLARLAQKHDDAKNASKEGAGTHRNAGDCGRIGAEWMAWRREARRRGLII